MNEPNFTTTFTVAQTPGEAFAAINDVRSWWSGDIDGDTATLGAEFTYSYQDIHRSTQQITELVPGRRVVWHVVAGYLKFTADQAEWTGTDIIFDIAPKGGQTEVRFTHVGLGAAAECFDQCSTAWSFYINSSLRNWIATGQGEPHREGRRADVA